MKEILLINPEKKISVNDKERKMVKRRKARKTSTAIVKYKPRRRARRAYQHNPAPTRRARTRAVIGRTLSGLNIKQALKDTPALLVGMFAAKWAAKRWGTTNPATEIDPAGWNWGSYLKGGLGAVLAGIAGNMIKRGSGQKILEGGINLMLYKAVQNELIVNSPWALAQFGAESDYTPSEYSGYGEEYEGYGEEYEGDDYQPGDRIQGEDGQQYMLGQDGEWRAAGYGYGDELAPVTSLGGSVLEPVGRLGEYDPSYGRVFSGYGDDVVKHGSQNDPYARAFFKA
jgi:hypothetical protein